MSKTKKKILILGYSSIVRRRVLPALKKIKKLKFEICSKSSRQQYIGESNWYRDYREALDSSDSEIVYISLPNSKHFKWAKKALLEGFHVIIDKPATTNLKETLELIKIAKMKKKFLAEALVYDYHKQISQALKFARKTNSLKSIHANFFIPAPNKKNIRSIKKLKSYCIYDMLPYAASIIRIFCKSKILKINISSKKEFQKKFSFISKFRNFFYTGHFCYGEKYQNNLTLFFKDKIIKLDRVFSPPSNQGINLKIVSRKKSYVIKYKREDVFYNFLKNVLNEIKNKKHIKFLNKLEKDCRIRETFIKSAKN